MDNINESIGSIESIDVGLLDIKKAEFYAAEGGFTGLRYDGCDYSHVTLKRALPLGRPMEYISVTDKDNKEIGIIKSVLDLDEGQLAIVTNELNTRYYCPQVREIKSVKDKLGYVYLELRLAGVKSAGGTQEYVRSCAVKDVNKNIRMLDENSLIIFDVDGNRYIVESLLELDKNSLRRLEPYLF